MKDTILVTGAAGFIGSYVSRALVARGDNVVGIDNFSDYYAKQAKEFNLDLTRVWSGEKCESTPEKELDPIAELFFNFYDHKPKNVSGKFTFIEADIRDSKKLEKIFKKYKITKVIHLAAMAGVGLSVQEPLLYTDVNINGTVNLLNLSVKSKVKKFVFGSSSSVYGEREEIPFRETDDVDQPISPYAATKRMQEIMNFTFHKLYNLPIINIRIFGPIYGPLQRPYRMLAQRFINLTYHDQPMTIFGDGEVGARDTTYIDDEVRGLILALDSDIDYEIINVGTGRTVTPQEVADGIKEIMGKGEISYIDRPAGEAPITYADVTKAKKLLNFEAEWKFLPGLERQIAVYEKMPKWYQDMEC